MCTYNGEKFLRGQLDSILAQTYPLYEIIIQDDGSTDGTMGILHEYASKDKRIHIFSNEAEHGVNGNFYSAMRRASGDFIAISDQDDIWSPDKIKLEVAAIGDSVMCGGLSVSFSTDDSFAFYDRRQANIGLLRLLFSAEVPGHTMLIRQTWLDSLPWDNVLFKERMYDWVLSVAAAAEGNIAWVNTLLVKHRQHTGSATHTDISTSIPTWSNSLHMLWWCIRNYKRVKKTTHDYFYNLESFVRHWSAINPKCRTGIRMLQLQQSAKLTDLIRFEFFCINHWTEILHTGDRNIRNFLHAVLYPLLSCWYFRGWIH